MNFYKTLLKTLMSVVTVAVLTFTPMIYVFASSTPQLVKDVNTDGQDTDFFDDGGVPVAINGVAYYTLSSPLYGDELWKSDGTEQGTVLVKDIYPGTGDSEPYGFHVLGNNLIFIADHPDYGRELWISDGTEQGTQLLKDIVPGQENGDISSDMVMMGGELYFVADNENEFEVLWKTDGTTLGTVIVGDPGTAFSSNDYYINIMGASTTEIFFIMYDYDNGNTSFLITYDGSLSKITDEALEPIDDIDDQDGTVLNNNLIFERCASEGCEPWMYDATAGTASLLLDITGNSNSSYPDDFTTLGTSAVLFRACADEWNNDCEMWTTDGTTLGTTQLIDINTGSGSSWPDIINASSSKLYFQARNNSNVYELWVTDGTVGGTSMVYELSWEESDEGIEDDPGESVIAGGKLYFQMCTGEDYDCELFATNSDDTGVYMVRDIWEGTNRDSDPDYFVEIAGGIILFGAENQEYGFELWRTDGTEIGTVLVKDVTTATVGSDGDHSTALGDTVIFSAYTAISGTELWISDGTEQGTMLLKDINPGQSSSYPNNLYFHNGKIYFTAETNGEGRELWVTDGTELGTQLVKDIHSGSSFSDIDYFAGMGDYVYFRAYTDSSRSSLWRSNGTEEGTTLVKTLDPGNSFVEEIVVSGDILFFRGFTSDLNYELWKSDGTEQGTVLVKDIYTGSNNGGYPSQLFVHSDGTLYFAARTADNGYELWKSDGTEQGTVLVKDIYPGTSDSYPGDFIQLGNMIYFYAYNDEYGTELWKSDGTEQGTVLVKDIRIGQDNSSPQEFVRIGNNIYFKAESQNDGYELWKSDGTEQGTVLVKDIYPGTEGSNINHIISAGDMLYFAAKSQRNDNGVEDVELWKSDGTEQGTGRVADIYPGIRGSYPYELTLFGDKLFFFAESPEYGNEPYVLTGLNVEQEVSGCTNPSATNYNAQATIDDGSCVLSQARRRSTGGMASSAMLGQLGISLNNSDQTVQTKPESTLCPVDQLLTQNLRSGARNGRFHPYTRGIVTEAKILQAHLNRLGFNSGPVDGILGPISDGAIKRMQSFLGIESDGFVGPITRGFINNSCTL